MTKLKPCGEKILVQPLAETTETVRGIFVPEKHRDIPTEGIVAALGQLKPRKNGNPREFEVKVGDRVFFNRFSGIDVFIERKPFKLLTPDELLALID